MRVLRNRRSGTNVRGSSRGQDTAQAARIMLTRTVDRGGRTLIRLLDLLRVAFPMPLAPRVAGALPGRRIAAHRYCSASYGPAASEPRPDVRLDDGFATPALFDLLDAEPGLDYVVAMAENAVLTRCAEPAMVDARATR
jgi:hypothetical protein